MVCNLREKYPFLKRWRLSEAQRCWDCSILEFYNVPFQTIEEFNEQILVERNGRFENRCGNSDIIAFDQLLPPLTGGVLNTHPTYIHPIDGVDVSEYSILYMASFLLSSLVRYRPEIWGHSINGRTTDFRKHDDHCMAMIENFLGNTLSTFPQYVIKSLEIKNKLTYK